MLIRGEAPKDRRAVHALNASAFETEAEADLVDRLRKEAYPVISLVAEDNGAVVGHIIFSPVSLSGHPGLRIMGLGPMAVAERQRGKGIGSALVKDGLRRCEQLGFGAVVVVGDSGYYRRFGFSPASRLGIGCEYEIPEDVFMAMELRDGYLRRVRGVIRYHAAFGGAGSTAGGAKE